VVPPETLPPPAAEPVTAVTLAPVAQGFEAPTFVGSAGDERLFVVEQRGRIRIVQDGEVVAEPFSTFVIRSAAAPTSRGCSALPFIRTTSENGYFFVNYTDRNGNTVISRFEVSDDP
jgi:glucose/arabinose dehydrogenase